MPKPLVEQLVPGGRLVVPIGSLEDQVLTLVTRHADGEGYDVRHPDMLLVGKRSATVGLGGNGDEPYYERTVKVDLLHISRIELLSAATKRKSNGKK